MRYDAVWTVDHHPSLCGTVKFSHQLAARLGVPVVTFTSAAEAVCPLLSFRASEIKNWRTAPQVPYGLFLHDWEPLDEVMGVESVYREQWVRAAAEVFAANRTIADQIRPLRSDVVTLFAPSKMMPVSQPVRTVSVMWLYPPPFAWNPTPPCRLATFPPMTSTPLSACV